MSYEIGSGGYVPKEGEDRPWQELTVEFSYDGLLITHRVGSKETEYFISHEDTDFGARKLRRLFTSLGISTRLVESS